MIRSALMKNTIVQRSEKIIVKHDRVSVVKKEKRSLDDRKKGSMKAISQQSEKAVDKTINDKTRGSLRAQIVSRSEKRDG